MILFRKYYKAANDEIETKRELIDKIFEEYAKTNKSKVYSFGRRYSVAFAAVLVLCVALMAYPKLALLNKEPINAEHQYVVENRDIEESMDVQEKQNINSARMAEREVSKFEVDISEVKSMTDDEITLATNTLEERLGTTDKNTGNMYIFEIVGRLDTETASFYLGRWKWLADDHTSLISEFVISDDLNGMYECALDGNTVSWNTEVNIFEKQNPVR